MMSINHKFYPDSKALPLIALVIANLAPTFADAAILNASLGGTFTMNMDRDALAQAYNGTADNPGHFLVHYYDSVESDYTTRTDSSFYLGNSSRVEVSALGLVHEITPIKATDPVGQAPNRYVKSTSPDFAVDSQTLTATGLLGMTGVELYKGAYGGTLIYGDYTLQYDLAGRQEVWDFLGLPGSPSGWYLQNNISFAAVAYELGNINLVVTDAGNWQMTGELLMSPVNSGLLKIPVMTDVGGFCLGLGAYAGCSQVSEVPVPAGVWLFVSGLVSFGFTGLQRRCRL